MSNWNGKVKCIVEVNPGKGTTLGNIYEVKNGKITYDNGNEMSHGCEGLEELNRWNTSKFETVKRGRPKKERIENVN